MDVIRHHNERINVIPPSIEVQQRVGDDLCQLTIGEDTSAVAAVQLIVPFSVTQATKLTLNSVRKLSELRWILGNRRIKTAAMKPICHFPPPERHRARWHRVGRAKRDKRGDVRLKPMGQVSLRNVYVAIAIKHTKLDICSSVSHCSSALRAVIS
jgi:hypothetical protein